MRRLAAQETAHTHRLAPSPFYAQEARIDQLRWFDWRWLLKKGEIVECRVEVISTCIVIRKGQRLRLDITPKDGHASAHFTHYRADYNAEAFTTIH